jgi:hypothetical protein
MALFCDLESIYRPAVDSSQVYCSSVADELGVLQLSTNQQGVSMQSSCQAAGATHCEQSRETVQDRLDLLFFYRNKAVEKLQQHRHVDCASCIHAAQPEDCNNKQKAL